MVAPLQFAVRMAYGVFANHQQPRLQFGGDVVIWGVPSEEYMLFLALCLNKTVIADTEVGKGLLKAGCRL